jgi:hypothetical protein
MTNSDAITVPFCSKFRRISCFPHLKMPQSRTLLLNSMRTDDPLTVPPLSCATSRSILQAVGGRDSRYRCLTNRVSWLLVSVPLVAIDQPDLELGEPDDRPGHDRFSNEHRVIPLTTLVKAKRSIVVHVWQRTRRESLQVRRKDVHLGTLPLHQDHFDCVFARYPHRCQTGSPREPTRPQRHFTVRIGVAESRCLLRKRSTTRVGVRRHGSCCRGFRFWRRWPTIRHSSPRPRRSSLRPGTRAPLVWRWSELAGPEHQRP